MRNKENYRQYLNTYMKKRWNKRRQLAITFLGGICVVCGADKNLEFDHIDPSTKVMTVARASSRSEDFFWNEVKKCQLLCNRCHKEKTRSDNIKGATL